MFCSKCGNQLPDSSRFCPNCGTKINAFVEQDKTIPVKSTNGFFGNAKRNINNSKIIILIMNGIILFSVLFLPYFSIIIKKTSTATYPVRLIGSNDYPGASPYTSEADIGWAFLLLAFISAAIIISYAVLANKYNLACILAAVSTFISFMGMLGMGTPIKNNRDRYPNTDVVPIGALIHIYLSIAILVVVIVLIKKEKKKRQVIQ